MNKKDFITLFVSFITTLILLIEHWCGLPLAFEFMCVWTIIFLITFICVTLKYVKVSVFVREDYTR